MRNFYLEKNAVALEVGYICLKKHEDKIQQRNFIYRAVSTYIVQFNPSFCPHKTIVPARALNTPRSAWPLLIAHFRITLSRLLI